jgi:hypothetical protein
MVQSKQQPWWWMMLLLCAANIAPHGLWGADVPETPTAPPLAEKQLKLAQRYDNLEAMLLKIAQIEATQNPRRAKLLMQAVEFSKGKQTQGQLNAIAELLSKKQLSRAIKEQTSVESTLEELLKLLQSEDRSTELKSEQERIREYIKEVDRMIRIQRSLQGQTEGQSDLKKLAEEQAKLAERVGDLSEKIRQNEEKSAAKPSAQNEQGKPPEASKEQQETPSSENKSPTDKPASSPEKQEQNQQPNSEQPSGEPSNSEPSNNKKEAGEKPNPVREKVDQARQRMKNAEHNLQQAQQKESVEEQIAAKTELEQAKAELERILKQLREEELEGTLTALEARFRKMLEMQVRILEGTKKIDAIPSDDRTREHDVQAGRLGSDETKLALEGEKALQILEEEGSSVAFPVTLEQAVDDMRTVAERLNQGKVESFTQALEEEIIASLEEFIAALQQAQQDLEKQKQENESQKGSSAGESPEQPLVNAIQELKMIKSLQLRVNTRTDRYARLLENQNDPVGQATSREISAALAKLSEREKQVFEIVRELLLNRNN